MSQSKTKVTNINMKALIPALILFIIAASVLSITLMPSKIERAITLEAGSNTPLLLDFLRDEDTKAQLITDLSAIDMTEPGVHRIKIKAGILPRSSKLIIQDTIAPEASFRDLEIPFGHRVKAEDFVTEIIDATRVSVSFLEEPDFSIIGDQDLRLLLEDAGENKLEASVGLYIGKVHKFLEAEIGIESLDIQNFLMDPSFQGRFITDISTIDLKKPASHYISIDVDGDTYLTNLEISDTKAPIGIGVDREIWLNKPIPAEDFVKNVLDYSPVTISYKEEPDFSLAGEQTVSILLEDTSQNKSELKANLFIKEDKEAPIIDGFADIKVYTDDKISYRKDVTVTDNSGETPELQVDSSRVNIKKPGSYEVVYRAVDSAGNVAEEIIKVTVMEKTKDYVDPEDLNKTVDAVLAKIIKEGMSDREKLKAIHQWTNRRITYTSSAYKKNWMRGAMQGIKNGSGDCFTYYSTARALLTRAGFENLCVTRDSKAKTYNSHYWNLVKFNGEWYHFDSCPHRTGYPYKSFLRTDEEVLEYSKKCKDYYAFDKSLYPPSSTTPVKQ